MASFFLQATFLCLISTAVVVVEGLDAPTATVVCGESGYSPTITQEFNDTTDNIRLKVTIGDGGAGCASAAKTMTNGNNTVNITELNGGSPISYNETCGTNLIDNADGLTISYATTIKVEQITVLRNTIFRSKAFSFALNCSIVQNVDTETAGSNFTVNGDISALPTTDGGSVNGTFELGTELKFYTDSSYNTAQGSSFTVLHGSTLYLQLKETNNNTLFKFAVEECWSTPDPSPTHATSDKFFQNMCPVDNTVSFVDNEQDLHRFSFQMTAFAFDSAPTAAVYIHCKLFVCEEDDSDAACVQKTAAGCPTSRRRRRSANADDNIEEMLVSTTQTFTVDNSQLFVPTCEEGFVFDRVAKECTNDRTMKINDIYLDQVWNPEYADTTSDAFRRMSREKSLQLYTLQQQKNGHIRGIKVVKATRGSVILDTLVTYEKGVSAKVAFEGFERVVRDASASGRIRNMLKLREDKVIEFVPIVKAQTEGGESEDTEKLTLIAVVCVLLVLMLVAFVGFTLMLKSRRSRSQTPFPTPGIDNKGVVLDTIA